MTMEQMSTPPANANHLSLEELDDVLIGGAGMAVTQHVKTCAACAARVADAGAPFAAFGAVTLEWAERRSATLPVGNPRAGVPMTARLAAAAALCVALIVGVTNPALHYLARSGAQSGAEAFAGQPASVNVDTAAERAQDNQMLAAVAYESDDSAGLSVAAFADAGQPVSSESVRN